MFTRLAINVNCDHNWLTNSYGPPKRRTSIKDDTFATTGNVASRAPDSSTIKSSAKDTRDPELPEDLGGCALFAAPVRFRQGGFLQNLRPATQEFPASSAGHEQNASAPDSVARSHVGHASTPRHPFDKPDNRNDSVCRLHR